MFLSASEPPHVRTLRVPRVWGTTGCPLRFTSPAGDTVEGSTVLTWDVAADDVFDSTLGLLRWRRSLSWWEGAPARPNNQ